MLLNLQFFADKRSLVGACRLKGICVHRVGDVEYLLFRHAGSAQLVLDRAGNSDEGCCP